MRSSRPTSQRKGGDASAVIKLITISDAGQGNVCSETTSNDLNLNDDLNLESTFFDLTWSDQDDSDRCLNFDVVDDTIVEGEEVICVHIEQVEGTVHLRDRKCLRSAHCQRQRRIIDYTFVISIYHCGCSCQSRYIRLHS